MVPRSWVGAPAPSVMETLPRRRWVAGWMATTPWTRWPPGVAPARCWSLRWRHEPVIASVITLFGGGWASSRWCGGGGATTATLLLATVLAAAPRPQPGVNSDHPAHANPSSLLGDVVVSALSRATWWPSSVRHVSARRGCRARGGGDRWQVTGTGAARQGGGAGNLARIRTSEGGGGMGLPLAALSGWVLLATLLIVPCRDRGRVPCLTPTPCGRARGWVTLCVVGWDDPGSDCRPKARSVPACCCLGGVATRCQDG